MNRIDRKFQSLKAAGKAAFMPYLSAGDPDLETTEKLIRALEAAGADILELGIPFSDPVADGPTIQAASQRALAGGVTLEKIFALVRRVREKSQLPINLMSYYNPIYHYGLEQFVEKMVEVGADGLIVPDLSLEEAHPLKELTVSRDLKLISFIAPTSSSARQKRIAGQADGFIYLVSLTGVTGARQQVNDNLGRMITEIRSYTGLPVCVGLAWRLRSRPARAPAWLTGSSSAARSSKKSTAAKGKVIWLTRRPFL